MLIKTPPMTVGIKDLGVSIFDLMKRKKKTAVGEGKGPAPASAAAAAPVASDEDVIKGYLSSLYAAYQSSPLTYVPQSRDALKAGIEDWLRPPVEQAIAQRKSLTGAYHAQLDADAIARGMGGSTYVTDVKSRQKDSEAGDITKLESDYAANLAKQLAQALEGERDRALETDMFNLQNDQAAYLKAYEAAIDLFKAYKGRSAPVNAGLLSQGGVTDWDGYLDGLSGEQRRSLYEGATADDLILRNRLICDVGAMNYLLLQQQYPTSAS